MARAGHTRSSPKLSRDYSTLGATAKVQAKCAAKACGCQVVVAERWERLPYSEGGPRRAEEERTVDAQ